MLNKLSARRIGRHDAPLSVVTQYPAESCQAQAIRLPPCRAKTGHARRAEHAPAQPAVNQPLAGRAPKRPVLQAETGHPGGRNGPTSSAKRPSRADAGPKAACGWRHREGCWRAQKQAKKAQRMLKGAAWVYATHIFLVTLPPKSAGGRQPARASRQTMTNSQKQDPAS